MTTHTTTPAPDRSARPVRAAALFLAAGFVLSVVAALLFPCPAPAAGQDLRLPVPDGATARAIAAEISGDAAYEHIRTMSRHHRSRGGFDGLWAVAEYVARTAESAGMADVRIIRQAYGVPPWNARLGDLRLEGDRPQRLASTLASPLHLADYSRAADVTAELVHVGAGSAAELDAAGVAGRVVLTHGAVGAVMREAVQGRGALGIVWYPSPYATGSGTVPPGYDRPDQLRWVSVPRDAVDGREPTFAFVLSLRQGLELRERLRTATEPVRVRAVVDAGFDSGQGVEPWQVMVEAYIRGSEPGLGQDIMLTAHIQEEATSANDDASGSANLLEIGRALARLIDEGRIERPRRNLRFWWVTEFSSQRQYFADHPDAHQRMWVNVNQDMVGADQSQDILRKQNVTRLPASRFHFFNDVVESVVEYVVAGNTAEIAQIQAGHPLYPEPVLSSLGSRHRYNAEMVFYHGNTDHVAFNEAPIGVPGITFTNMPDRYIHSSDDDLWNIDRTQLQRNAVAATLIAWAMADADGRSAGRMAAETAGRGAERIARNLRLGLGWIADAAQRTDAAYHRAADQVRFAVERERRATRSLDEIGRGAAPPTAALLAELDRREAQALRELGVAYRAATGRAPPSRPALSDAERSLERLRPGLAAGPAEFLTGRGRIRGVPGLHGLMAAEVLSSIDGRRTGLDIYRMAAAQAREAGAHYYGVVTPEAVLRYLENVREAGLIR